MATAPPGLEIYETRRTEPVRVLYGAIQRPLGRKVLLVGLAPGVLPSSPLAASLAKEAEVLSRLDHPNIVQLYDFKRSEDEVWLVLEDSDDWSLSELVGKKIEWNAAAAIGLDVARALSHAHQTGIIHGKLSPEMVHITRNGRTKLGGFGRLSDAGDNDVEPLEPSERGGLAPETSVGQPPSTLSDIFAWGMLMYELCAAVPPFGKPQDAKYPMRVRTERQTPLLKVRHDLPQALTDLIEQCLDKNPNHRPANMEVLAEQLQSLVSGTTLPTIQNELSRLGLAQPTDGATTVAAPQASHSGRFAARRGLLVLAGLAAGVLLMAIWARFRQPEVTLLDVPGTSDLMATDESMRLRVVATPWAHVFVDGVQRETTPFSQPIVLSAGRHVVRLEHPQAPPEERVVEGQTGQIVLLSVHLHVQRPPQSSLQIEEAPEESTP